jgi:hypothetical protein
MSQNEFSLKNEDQKMQKIIQYNQIISFFHKLKINQKLYNTNILSSF